MFKRIAILGEIGSGNLGDDLGYVLIKKEIEKHFDFVQVDWITPSRFSTLDYMGYDCVALGCGTLLDRAGGHYVKKLHEMQQRNVPTAILGSGMSDERHIVPTKEGDLLLSEVMTRVRFSWLRGEAPDPMWLLGNQKTGKGTDIGINMGFAGYTIGGIFDIKQKVETARNYLMSKNLPVKNVSCWTNDNIWVGEPDIQVDSSLRSISQLNQLKAIVAFRGHLGVVASCCGVVPISVAYSSKIKEMFQCTSIPVYFLDPTQKNWTGVIDEALTCQQDFTDKVVEAQTKVQELIKEFCERIK